MSTLRSRQCLRPAILASLLLSLAGTALASPASAQTATRRRVPAGEVTGLEMGIEGSLVAMPGAEVRWFVTLYEVLRRRDLRPAADATLTVSSTHSPGAPVAEVTTDREGRATIALTLPDELDSAPRLRVTARTATVQRVFAVDLQSSPRFAIELFVDRSEVPPNGTVTAFGRVLDRVDGRPVEGMELTLNSGQQGITAAPVSTTTDSAGVFMVPLELGATVGRTNISAHAAHAGTATRRVVIGARTTAPLWVEAHARDPIVSANGTTTIDVLVRDPAGRAVRGARVQMAGVEEPPFTDAEGRARVTWRAPAITDPLEYRDVAVRVTHPGRGTATATASMRVVRAPWLAGFSIEGGALVPGLDGRVYVRVVDPTGAPLPPGPIALEAARLGGTLAGAITDDGVAVFEAPVSEASGPSECGGSTATEAFLVHDGHRQRLCLPVDPDATLSVRDADPGNPSAHTVQISRRASVAGRPVEVTALAQRLGEWVPLQRQWIGRGREARFELPRQLVGEIWFRARPVFEDGRAAVGGGLLLWHGPRPQIDLSADGEGARIERLESGAAGLAFAVEGDADGLLEALRGSRSAASASLFNRTEMSLAASLAARLPRDVAANTLLREGELSIQPLPESPREHGLLRDPWRTRARFVRGRIGRLMRAVESYVEERVPDQIEECAVRAGRGWRFNHAVLEAAMNEAGIMDENATSLDGERLDIEALNALDRAFTYDHVARRITRERLFRVLLWVRQLVRRRQLDRPWARRGETRQTLVAMLDRSVAREFDYASPDRAKLYDGWGQPFELRRVRGRARFSFLEPLAGWEVVSAGPDGRFGTGDDVVDPFARVLPSGGPYAEAVGEDVLLARLGGVVLGRATAESLADLYDVNVEGGSVELAREHPATLGGLPSPIAAPPSSAPLDPVLRSLGARGARIEWSDLPPERRHYAVVGVGFDPDGGLAVAHTTLDTGIPWAARLDMPIAMRPGEDLRVALSLLRLGEGPEPEIRVEASGAVRASAEGREVRLVAQRAGRSQVRVIVLASGRELASFEESIRVVPTGGLRARHAGTRVDGSAELEVRLPEGARPWRGEIIAGAPRALSRDPMVAPSQEDYPALFAWAQVMEGAPLNAALSAATRADAGRAGTGLSSLEAACALVAWATEENGERPPPVQNHLTRHVPTELEERAAVLAALAAAVSDVPTARSPLVTVLRGLRQDGWRALATASDRPAAMARMAAALLIVDRDDAPGRALLARAAERLETDAHGRRWVPGDAERAGDGWIGTVALAIAARQTGRDALADELSANVIGRLYLARRAGVEGIFWTLAASVYGALGVDAPTSIQVAVDGVERSVPLEDGLARVPLPGSASVRVSSASPIWVRTEARYLVPWETSGDGPLEISLEGDPGVTDERAALEVVLENGSDDPVGAPVVELTLPGAGRLDTQARAAMTRNEAVSHVSEPDGAGVVRVRLVALPGRSEHRFALPIRWIASGQTRGLALVTYDASTPWSMAAVEERELSIGGER